jgi:dipeptidyl aminopeptidase/acylaminoacyl peptidase
MSHPATARFARGLLLALCIGALPTSAVLGQVNYARAEQLLTWNATRLITGDAVVPNWLADDTRFWYRSTTPRGGEFVLVDPAAKTRRLLFENHRLAAAMSLANDTTYDPVKLPFDTLELIDNERGIRVKASGKLFTCVLARYQCTTSDTLPSQAPLVLSPDSAWEAFVHRYDVYIRPRGGGDSSRLTRDGEEFWSYGLPYPRPNDVRRGTPRRPDVHWSPDSRKLAVYRLDQRKVEHMHYVSSTPQRPKHYSQPYALPGDTVIPVPGFHILEIGSQVAASSPGGGVGRASRDIKVAVDPTPHQLFLGGSAVDSAWSEGSDRLYVTYFTRGSKRAYLAEVAAATGASRILVAESTKTFVELTLERYLGAPNWAVANGGNDIIWFSERDGWGHLYRYDGRGNLKNQITSGPWTVGEIHHVDDRLGRIYFTGRGREHGRDIYYAHLYAVGFDGSDLRLLTPEDANHTISFAPAGGYFVDTYSRVDQPPVTVLRATDGRVLLRLEEGDISRLREIRWRQPEPFRVKARDGITELHGMMYKPTDFDSTRKYPIIDHIYPGPQIITAPKSFFPTSAPGLLYATMGQVQALAELGFIVVHIDHLGGPYRSKAFHDNYYGNFGDNGIPDHVSAIKQLAARHPYIDIERVGIYGHSGGGFASTDAILRYPDFFKVAVSTSGNHDNRSYHIYWAEKYQGLLVRDTLKKTDNFEGSANKTLAGHLKGKLLLVHGDMDDNVHPAMTLQLADALIKANKAFDMLILPDVDHDVTQDPYVIRRTWDYFVEHLLGKEPPTDYAITAPPKRPGGR